MHQGNRIKKTSLIFGDKALLTHSYTIVGLLGWGYFAAEMSIRQF